MYVLAQGGLQARQLSRILPHHLPSSTSRSRLLVAAALGYLPSLSSSRHVTSIARLRFIRNGSTVPPSPPPLRQPLGTRPITTSTWTTTTTTTTTTTSPLLITRASHCRKFSTSPPRPAAPKPAPRPSPKRTLYQVLLGLTFIGLGLILGTPIRLILSPPPSPHPSSDEDKTTIAILAADAAELPIVKSLSSDPEWESWNAYASIPPGAREHRLTTGPLAGSRGLGGYQRVFWNAGTGETVVVLWMGSATNGWPGVVHGGVLGTVMDECLGRTAIKGVGEAAVTGRLEMRYLAPVGSSGFVVVRCVPEVEGGGVHEGGKVANTAAEGDMEEGKGNNESGGWFGGLWGAGKGAKKGGVDGYKGKRKMWVKGRMETVGGQVCVEARGLFVVPKGFRLKPLQEDF